MSDLTDNLFYASAVRITLGNIATLLRKSWWNVAECMWKLHTNSERREEPSASYVHYFGKKVKDTVVIIDKLKREKPKTMRIPENIAAVAESVREAPSTSIHRRSQHFLNISEASLSRILHKDLGIMPYKDQWVPELKQIVHPVGFRFAKWACDRLTENAAFGKKNLIFSWSKIVHLGHRKSARIYLKAVAPITGHFLVRILVQSHNWAILFRRWARSGHYS